jgi:hypothetical protein
MESSGLGQRPAKQVVFSPADVAAPDPEAILVLKDDRLDHQKFTKLRLPDLAAQNSRDTYRINTVILTTWNQCPG